jgi:type VI secretion system Hcp family effector
LNKLLSFAALIIVGFAISGLIIYGVIQFAPSNDAKNAAYSQFEANGVKTCEAFLMISGIPGSSIDALHDSEIEIEEFSWSETQSGSVQAGAGVGQVEMEDFQFIFEMDPKASPGFFLACAEGRVLEKVVLTVRSNGELPEEFMKVTFSSVLISSFQTLGNTYQGQHPMDAITIEYSRIQFEYIDAYGQQHRAGWDLPSNTPI